MSSTAQDSSAEREWREHMEEKIYKTMSGSGALNIVVGVVTLVAGITGGVLLIISGARLLSSKSKILFLILFL